MAQQWCKVLVVDDEPGSRPSLRDFLSYRHFEVSGARTGDEAIAALRRSPTDTVLLNLVGLAALDTCRRIRRVVPFAIAIVMMVRDSEEDGIEALNAGADDFITRPYRERELIGRLLAAGRRVITTAHRPEAVLRAGNIELDLERRRVRKCDISIHLTPKEFDLFTYLFRRPGVTVLHSKLLRVVWGLEYGGEVECLRTCIRTLRAKIEDDPARPKYILTEPWVGYRFCDRMGSINAVIPFANASVA